MLVNYSENSKLIDPTSHLGLVCIELFKPINIDKSVYECLGVTETLWRELRIVPSVK